jgi:tetratricopeptide (TPR) repeat protein
MSEGPNGSQDSRSPGRPPDHSDADSPQGDPQAWYERGLDLLSRGSPAAAAQILERAAEAEPGSRSVREALARAQFDARRYADAADNFRLIVEASPADDYANFGLGLSLARSGDPASAAEYLALAAAMRPDSKHYANALLAVRARLSSRTSQPPGETLSETPGQPPGQDDGLSTGASPDATSPDATSPHGADAGEDA